MSASPAVPNRIGLLKFPQLSNIETGITAHAGGGQTSAYQLTAQISRVDTVASGNDSVKLPKITNKPGVLGSLGSILFLGNNGANALKVYGASPDTINAVATGTGNAVAAGVNVWLVATSYTPSTDVGTWLLTNSQAAAVAAITSGTIAGATITTSTFGAGNAFSVMPTIPSATVAATGADQAGAAPITTGFTLVSGADDAKGVKLPTAAAGLVAIVKNNTSAKNLLVYPFSGDAINAIAANSALTMAGLTSAVFVAYDATTWYTVPLLPS